MQQADSKSFRDEIATVDESGKRKWIFPKKVKGKWMLGRQVFGYSLLLLLFIGPFLRIDGEPLLLLNILERKFILLGQVFWPQDFYIFVFLMLIFVLFVVLFTVAFGRLFCGWACPQTIFMEHVFRRIEYWIDGDYKAQMRLKNGPWNTEKIIKRVAKYTVFLAISFFIANIFLAYIIGSTQLLRIITDNPLSHLGGLSAIVVFTLVFFFVFAYMREQVCIAICPYGRLQGVMLDRNSIVVAYDYKRGEQRAKIHKGEDRASNNKGDCIDCHQCVDVCPTGIDIRNGTQLECINCTACIDACNHMMEQVQLPQGLIRYASENNIVDQQKFKFTTRLIAYSVVLGLLLVAMVAMLVTRTSIEATVLRAQGMLYQQRPDHKISNLYTAKIVNKTNIDMPIAFKLKGQKGTIEPVGSNNIKLNKQDITEATFYVVIDENDMTQYKTNIVLEVISGNKVIDKVKTNFIGKMKRKTKNK